MTHGRYAKHPEDDPRPNANRLRLSLNWAILGQPAELRRLYLDERMPIEELAVLCNCSVSTVERWRRLYEIPTRSRAMPKVVRLTPQQRLEFIRETAARVAYVRFGKCRDDCPHQERCDRGCPFEEAE